MDYFNYKKSDLYAEDIAIKDICKKIKTPFYLYSKETFSRHYKVIDKALDVEHKLICFACKANGNINILKILIELGAGIDVVSAGEIYKALKAGCDPQKIVFSGVGKTEEEIIYGLKKNILQFNVESKEEIAIIDKLAKKEKKIAQIALRLNPNISAGGHAKISTGKKGDKFGIDIDEAEEIIKYALKLKNINFQGVSTHIGSQICKLEPFEQAFTRLFTFIKHLEQQKIKINVIDLGGGLAAPYDEAETLLPDHYGEMIKKIITEYNFQDKKIIIEPGRVIAANAGIIVSKVILIKQTKEKKFIILDMGMNDLMRPALYDAKHQFLCLAKKIFRKEEAYDIVGPVCETSDLFAQNIKLPQIKNGEFMALRSAGAYGAVMSNEYNARPLITEILVDKNKFKIIRRSPSFAEMTRLEDI
jgi:diaminopimelate decarboxylase